MTKEGSGPTEQLTAVTAGRLEAETAVLIVAHVLAKAAKGAAKRWFQQGNLNMVSFFKRVDSHYVGSTQTPRKTKTLLTQRVSAVVDFAGTTGQQQWLFGKA